MDIMEIVGEQSFNRREVALEESPDAAGFGCQHVLNGGVLIVRHGWDEYHKLTPSHSRC